MGDRRKREIREEMAATGLNYTRAAREVERKKSAPHVKADREITVSVSRQRTSAIPPGISPTTWRLLNGLSRHQKMLADAAITPLQDALRPMMEAQRQQIAAAITPLQDALRRVTEAQRQQIAAALSPATWQLAENAARQQKMLADAAITPLQDALRPMMEAQRRQILDGMRYWRRYNGL